MIRQHEVRRAPNGRTFCVVEPTYTRPLDEDGPLFPSTRALCTVVEASARSSTRFILPVEDVESWTPVSAPRALVVAEVLRFLSDGWVNGEDDQKWLRETADQIERDDRHGMDATCCPLCAEITCDEDCPLRGLR